MTLIVTAVCDEFIAQISDRRFSAEGLDVPVSDEGTKQVIVRGPGYDLVAGFTGLANVSSTPDAKGTVFEDTGMWLASTMADGNVLRGGMNACVEAVRRAADDAFKRIYSHSNRRLPLTIEFAGFGQSSGALTVATVTNCRDPRFKSFNADDSFSANVRYSAGPECLIAGVTAAWSDDATQKVRAVLKRRNYPATVDVVVQLIRDACRRPKYKKYVGPNCTAVYLSRRGEVEAIYDPVHGRRESFGPHVVDYADGAVMLFGSPRTQIFGDPPPEARLSGSAYGPSGTRMLDRRELQRPERRKQ